MAFMFGEMPEDMRQQIQQEKDRQLAIHHAFTGEVKDLLEALKPEQLATLRVIFNDLADHDGQAMARYYEGIISGHLMLTYGVCPGCGHDHAEEFLEKAIAEEDIEEEGSE